MPVCLRAGLWGSDAKESWRAWGDFLPCKAMRRPGRTLVGFETQSDSRLYHLQLRAGFTEAEYYDFVQPAGLGGRLFDGEPESVPFYTVTAVGLNPGERMQGNFDLRESTYFLFPIVGEHMSGGRALGSSELKSIRKLQVQ